MKIAVPSDTSEGLRSRVSYLFGRAPYIVILEVEGKEIRDVKVESNPHAQLPGGAGPALAQYLLEKGVQVVLASDIGPNAAGALSSSGISWIPVPAGITVEDAVRSYAGMPQVPQLPMLPLSYPLTREDEIRWLSERKEWIKKRLEEIERRLAELS